jgi:hypothetical protein
MSDEKMLRLLLTHYFNADDHAGFLEIEKKLFIENVPEPMSLYVIDPKLIVVGKFTEDTFAPDKEGLRAVHEKKCRQTVEGLEEIDNVPVEYFGKLSDEWVHGKDLDTAQSVEKFPEPNKRPVESIEIKRAAFLYRAEYVDGEVKADPTEFHKVVCFLELTPERYKDAIGSYADTRLKSAQDRIRQVKDKLCRLKPFNLSQLVSPYIEGDLNALNSREADLEKAAKRSYDGGSVIPAIFDHLRNAYTRAGVEAVENVVKAGVAQLPRGLDRKYLKNYLLTPSKELVGAKS